MKKTDSFKGVDAPRARRKPVAARNKTASGGKSRADKGTLVWTSLGGNNPDNIGGNCHAYSYRWTDARGQPQEDTILVDMGIMFADKEKTRLDSVFPDASAYVRKAGGAPPRHRAKALVLTHGHMDHIGAIAHMIGGHPDMRYRLPPVYGTPMTIEMLKNVMSAQGVKPNYWPALNVVGSPEQIKAYEASLAKGSLEKDKWPTRHVLERGEPLTIGRFRVEFVPVSHSMCNAAALHIQTPAAKVLHTGDCKTDQTLLIGPPTDIDRLREIGQDGIDGLMIDSTRANAEGFTPPEAGVRAALLEEVEKFPSRRIVIALMGSNMERIAGVAEVAAATGRTLTTHGAAIEKSILAAKKAGITLESVIDPALAADLKKVSGKSGTAHSLAPEQELALATGTQGETNAAIWKAAHGTHKTLHLGPEDVVIMSASPIPGNEEACKAMFDAVRKTGATLITSADAPVHVSGHGHREDLKTILSAANPAVVFPVHGDHIQTADHSDFARKLGYVAHQVRNGTHVELKHGQAPREIAQSPANWIGVIEEQPDAARPWVRRYQYKSFNEDSPPGAPRPAKAPGQAVPEGKPRRARPRHKVAL